MNFGASSFDIHVFAYIKANDQNEYAGILEDLNLRVLDIIRGVGTDLAYPSSTIFFEKGTNRDLQKIYEVEKEIASIKESEGFPLPHYPSDWVDEKIDTLPFPEKS